MYQKEIPVCINIDNRTVSNVTISEEYEKLSKNFNFSLKDFEIMNKNALRHAFVEEEVKEKLIKKLEEKTKEIENKKYE